MIKAREKFLLGIVTAMFAAGGAFAADVPAPQGRVARGLVAGTANAPQVQQATGRSRMPMMAARPAEAVQEEEATTTAEADAGFGAALDKRFEGEAVDERALAKERAAAREEYDMAENAFLRGISAAGKSKCETELRVCVANDCGDDMQKCMGDGDGIWSARFQKCRATTSCNGAEIGVYGDIIKEDMRVDSKLHTMQMIIEGNNMYSRCLQDNCATTQGTPMEGMVGFNACVTQVRINQALDACKHIYEKFRPYDSGLQARFTTMMGQLRVEKEKRIAELQKELDEMMPQMRQECKAAGAVFDDRSGECVFTAFLSVEHDGRRFTAASKKLVPGSEYQCTDKWFGIDITTFMKNAIGLTIEQKSASAAFMGAGLGVAASVGTSMIADKLGDKGEVLDKAKALAPAAAPTPEKKAPTEKTFQVKDASFVSGKADLKMDDKKAIDEIVGNLNQSINAGAQNWTINIVGHTDNIGSKEVNDKLSLARAKNVTNYLVKALQLNNYSVAEIEKRITVKGQGQELAASKGMPTTDSNENRAAGAEFRRVDIILNAG